MMRMAALLCGGLLVGLLVGGALIGRAQETLVLTTPVQSAAGATVFRLWMLQLQRAHPDTPAVILANFREVTGTAFLPSGRILLCRFDGDPADALIVALNKVNLATTSLEKRVTQQCQMSGQLGAGNIVGTVQ